MKILKLLGSIVATVVVAGAAFMTFKAIQLDPNVELGTPSPDVAVTTLDDASLSLASLRGKVVLLDFWATT